MDIIAELGPELRDEPGEKCGHLVKIGVIGGVTINAAEADTLKELVDPRPHGLVIDQADIGQHMREMFLAAIPVRHEGAGINRLVTGHNCRPRGWRGFALAGFPAAPSSSHR